MAIQLRLYQNRIIDDTRNLMRQGIKKILIQSPTGSGKTALTAHMLHSAANKGLSCWFNVHRRELIKQAAKAFTLEGIKYGIVSAGFDPSYKAQIQIASIQTLAKRYKKIKSPKLIVWDECHHTAAGSWAKIHSEFPDAFHIGLTATPERLDGKGLKKWFDAMVSGPSVSWLIENRFLAPYRIFAPPGIDTSQVKTVMGDFSRDQLAAASDKPTITGDAIQHYRKHADGKRAVVFCASREHSKHVVAQFNASGIPAAHIDGETDIKERDNAIRLFDRGEILVLSNVELFGEGFDLPSIEVAILLRPTQSLGLYLQQCGRALRPCVGKQEAIILDHAGNCQRHGLPDEEREWSLDGRIKWSKAGNNQTSKSVKICQKCFAAQFSGATQCRFCHHVFEVEGRKVEEVEGNLEEVDPAIIRKRRMVEQGRAQTLEDLIRVGKIRGYKNPYHWAKYVFQARQAKKLRGGSYVR